MLSTIHEFRLGAEEKALSQSTEPRMSRSFGLLISWLLGYHFCLNCNVLGEIVLGWMEAVAWIVFGS